LNSALCEAPSVSSNPLTVKAYSFDNIAVIHQLLGTWFSVLTYKSIPEDIHRKTAKELYALIFQCWLVTEYQHKPIFMAENGIKNMMALVKPYVDINDPMSLNSLYEGNNLGAFGLLQADAAPLTDSEAIFNDKQKYHELATQFVRWLDYQK
jgi:hypothetical protein